MVKHAKRSAKAKRIEVRKAINVIGPEKILNHGKQKDNQKLCFLLTELFGKQYNDFVSNTSLHGFKFVANPKSTKLERFWWLTCIMISICMCTFLIIKVYIKWKTNPVIVSIEETTTPVWQIPFPAVTICPAAKVDKSKYNYAGNCRGKVVSSYESLGLFYAAKTICHLTDKCVGLNPLFINHEDLEAYVGISLNISSTIKMCDGLDGEAIMFCDNLFREILTEEGVCFTLNMLNADEIFTEDASANLMFLDEHKRLDSKGWTIDEGYPSDATFETYPFRAMASDAAVSMEIVISHDDSNSDYECMDEYTGFRVSVHAPNIIPNPRKNFFWASFDMKSIVSLIPNMMITTPELRQYYPHVRQCYFADEKKLMYFREYTRNNCDLECLTNYTLITCGCVTVRMPRNISTMVCGPGSLYCANEAKISFSKLVFSKGPKDGTDSEKIAYEEALKCDCLPSCTSIEYETSIFQSSMNWTEDGKKISMVTLSFNRPYFNRIKRSEVFGIVDFLANCGGLLGVCLGFSIISLIEILYYSIIGFLFKIRGGMV